MWKKSDGRRGTNTRRMGTILYVCDDQKIYELSTNDFSVIRCLNLPSSARAKTSSQTSFGRRDERDQAMTIKK